MQQNNRYDVIVIGGGTMGSAATYELAKRGKKVLVLEQFDFVHDNGAHAGQSRIIRKAYFEHPDYVPLLERAYALWKALEAEAQTQLYYETGLLYFGKKGDELLTKSRESARKHRIPLVELSVQALKKQYPMFRTIPDDWDGFLEPEAGFLLPEKAVKIFLERAIVHGAHAHAQETVIQWASTATGISVRTNKAVYEAERLVITAGAWSNKILGTQSFDLTVTRQVLGWVVPPEWSPFELGAFPCWFVSDPPNGLYYGMPILPSDINAGTPGLKIALHCPGQVTDPDHVDRKTTTSDEATFRDGIRRFLPDADGALSGIKTCLYTYSPDEHFIIDQIDENPQVIFACGFSGHGFKFAPVIGAILADLACEGATDLPIDFLSVKRL